jgi:hypothetical protein
MLNSFMPRSLVRSSKACSPPSAHSLLEPAGKACVHKIIWRRTRIVGAAYPIFVIVEGGPQPARGRDARCGARAVFEFEVRAVKSARSTTTYPIAQPHRRAFRWSMLL